MLLLLLSGFFVLGLYLGSRLGLPLVALWPLIALFFGSGLLFRRKKHVALKYLALALLALAALLGGLARYEAGGIPDTQVDPIIRTAVRLK